MDFNQLKKLAKKLGGILVLNGNEPEFVILPYSQYEKENNAPSGWGEKTKELDEEEKTIEKLNQEILVLKEEIRQKESAELIQNTGEDEPATEIIDLE